MSYPLRIPWPAARAKAGPPLSGFEKPFKPLGTVFSLKSPRAKLVKVALL